MEREEERFEIETDAGERHTIVRIRELKDASNQDGPATIPGFARLESTDGCAVDDHGDGMYTIQSHPLVKGRRV